MDTPQAVTLTRSKADKEYRVCNRCIMDTHDDPDISFNEEGICNHCTTYEYRAKTFAYKGDEAKKQLQLIADKIREDGKGKRYDCVMGVSGGVDSTYMALQAKELGLRPLVLHLDNGWDSELAVKNIEHIVNSLDLDLSTGRNSRTCR